MSVRQRAVDLLYAMCDRSNAKQIVAEMLSYLETADYSIREEIVGHQHRPVTVEFLFVLLLPSASSLFSSGAQGGYPGRKICCRLHLVCGHHPQLNSYSW